MEQQNKKIVCLCSENDETGKLNEEAEEKSAKLEEQAKMPKIEAEKTSQKTLIHCRGLPAELLNEIFASMPLKNAFALLAKMPNVILERIVRKMFTNIKMKMKLNKWNPNDCSGNLAISENGLEVTQPHPHGRNCVRAIFPVPQLGINAKHIAAYFEAKFLKKASWFGDIGFCDKLFPLGGKRPGNLNNSIGIWSKYGMHIDGNFSPFQNAINGDFKVGDVVGIGLINSGRTNSPLECFSTCNGKLLGVIELPTKFSNLQLFPTVSLWNDEMTIRTNFGQEEWIFNLSHFLQSKRK